MKPLAEWDESDLQRVVEAKVRENISVDYKDSQALNFDDKTVHGKKGGTEGELHRRELIRDVSAFANAEGGNIYFGIKEDGNSYPKEVDTGYDPTKTSANRIEQILLSSIHPRLQGFHVQPIELRSRKTGACAFVVEVHKALSHGPHQADDKIYYTRRDEGRKAMDDNEVRDAMRRSIEYGKKYGTAWDLYVELRRLDHAMRERVQIDSGAWQPRARLIISVSNDLRAAGVAIMALDKEMRMKVADLVVEVDRFNSIIEVVDPGQHDQARMTEALKKQLLAMIKIAQPAYASLRRFVDEAP